MDGVPGKWNVRMVVGPKGVKGGGGEPFSISPPPLPLSLLPFPVPLILSPSFLPSHSGGVTPSVVTSIKNGVFNPNKRNGYPSI